ncbi:MAG: M81 family metallopeptidase, partial [Anaerolineae bacterium]|nr:M81 family metallopeptidase [Anaerolineae bacterium]
MSQTKRIAIGGILHETHTFAPGVTDLSGFSKQALYEGEALLREMTGTRTPIGAELETLAQAGYTPVPLIYAAAMPSGIVTAEAYSELRARFLARLRDARPVDGVLLSLHGAMAAENDDDPEGDLMAQTRALVGPNCPIVSVLDMHGNISPRMVEATDVLIANDWNPHIDSYERGLEAGAALRRMLDEGLKTAQAIEYPPLLLSALATWTQREQL